MILQQDNLAPGGGIRDQFNHNHACGFRDDGMLFIRRGDDGGIEEARCGCARDEVDGRKEISDATTC